MVTTLQSDLYYSGTVDIRSVTLGKPSAVLDALLEGSGA